MSIAVAGGGDTSASTPWIKIPSFSNGWGSVAGWTASYRKVGDIVYLQGQLSAGTTSTTAFTLPAGFRPASAVVVNCWFGLCTVNTNGTFVPGASAVMHLTGVCFSVGTVPP